MTARKEMSTAAALEVVAAAAVALDNGSRGPDVDIKALLRSSRLPEKTVPICLRGDLVAEFEELERQLAAEQERETADKRLNSRSVQRAIAEKMAALREQMAEATVVFRLRALSKPRWRALRDEHPPRKGEDGNLLDEDSLGINIDTFFEPLVRLSVVSPKLDDEDWALLLGVAEPTEDEPEPETHALTSRQFDSLAGPAYALNRSEVDIPFSRAASRVMQNSEPE